MRPLPLLGLLAGLAMLCWGGYSLYARFSGGPEVFWGTQKQTELTELTSNVDDLRTVYARDEAMMIEYREKVAAMPAGPAKEAEARDLEEVTKILRNHDKEVKERELLLGSKLFAREMAKTRALLRGIAFPILGLVCLIAAGRAVLRMPIKRTPSTSVSDPSPPSPRPGG